MAWAGQQQRRPRLRWGVLEVFGWMDENITYHHVKSSHALHSFSHSLTGRSPSPHGPARLLLQAEPVARDVALELLPPGRQLLQGRRLHLQALGEEAVGQGEVTGILRHEGPRAPQERQARPDAPLVQVLPSRAGPSRGVLGGVGTERGGRSVRDVAWRGAVWHGYGVVNVWHV